MKTKALILTTTEPGNTFPENFSCWCAGALEAKGCDTALETVNLGKIVQSSSNEPVQIKNDHLVKLRATLSMVEKLVLILPEYNNMLPAGLDNFIELASAKRSSYKFCKLIGIIVNNQYSQYESSKHSFIFRYPLHKLDLFFGADFSTSRIQINSSPTGDMCPLFADSYEDLCKLVQQILA